MSLAHPGDPVCLIVTGMHRSATSLVASLLHQAGLSMGADLLGSEVGNQRGHFEDRDFFDFHQRALLARGRLPVMGGEFAFTPTLAESAAARSLVARRQSQRAWGFKDPRACLFLDFWRLLIPEARFLFLYRHPLEVLSSLVRRLEPLADLTTGLAAWRLYNQHILAFCRQHRDRAVLCHAYAAIECPEAMAAAVSRLTGTGVKIDAAARDRLYQADELTRLDLASPPSRRFADLFPDLQALYDELEAGADLSAPSNGSGEAAEPPQRRSGVSTRSDDSPPRLALIELLAIVDPGALDSAIGQTGLLLEKLLVEHHSRPAGGGAERPLTEGRQRTVGASTAALRNELLERLPPPAPPTVAAGEPPLVSVIVVNLNGASLLPRCLDCLLLQTYPRFEIIVVDNASTDGSLELLETYAAKGAIRLLRSRRNRGCAGGRNLGLRRAKGDFVAFIDNDGYAHPRWLEETLRVLTSRAEVGAVAPLVFFAGKPTIVNGVGGRLNLQGYGCDVLTKTPLEFAQPPDEVLYPMGCGMVVRRAVLRRGGRFDEALLNYYDDVELGIRAWKLGYRVAVASRAWVDHDFSSSVRYGPPKAELSEKGRIRTVLKYYPLGLLREWLSRERRYRDWYPNDGAILRSAWRWNLLHLGSALAWRLRFALTRGRFDHLLAGTWGPYPAPIPPNETFHPFLEASGQRVILDGQADEAHLNFGWYYPEQDGPISYRWTDVRASLLLRLDAPAHALLIDFCLPFSHQTRILLRRWGLLEPVLSATIEPRERAWGWTRQEMTCAMEPGDYEVLLLSDGDDVDAWGRSLGVAVSRLEAR